MLTLTTGGPGTGKTAFLISELIKIKAQQPYRDFFIHGIRDFKAFKHQTIYCKSPLCDLCRSQEVPENGLYVEDWPTWYKSHYMIVVDEVQRIWGQSNGSNKTDAISRLQTHRHYGLDFWLVSQSPKLIHTDVKAMVGRHIHLEAKWSGRKQYEWSEVRENTLARTDAVVRPYTLPKSVFKLYKSAEVHTVQEKRKPMSFYATIFVLCLCVVFAAAISIRFSDRFGAKPKTVDIASVSAGAGVGGALAPPAPAPDETQTVKLDTVEAVAKAFTPVIPALPWTAPVYRELAKPVSFPRIVGCIQNVKKCACYTQQATIVDIPDNICRMAVLRKSFNMFKPDGITSQTASEGEQQRPPQIENPQSFIKHG